MKEGHKVLAIIVISLICVGSIAAFLSPSMHFWKSDYEKGLSWCELYKPIFNDSSIDNVRFCYGEGWENYCKISYPSHCPDNESSDYERCLENCRTYNTKDCPCINNETGKVGK